MTLTEAAEEIRRIPPTRHMENAWRRFVIYKVAAEHGVKMYLLAKEVNRNHPAMYGGLKAVTEVLEDNTPDPFWEQVRQWYAEAKERWPISRPDRSPSSCPQ